MASTGHRVAIVGAGIVGLSTALALAERDVYVRVYERGRPGGGQSAGEGRIFRHAHDDPRLAELTREGRAVWAAWESELGIETVSGDGVLAIGEPVPERAAVLERVGGVELERPDPDRVKRLLPLLAEFDAEAMFEPGAGAIRTREVIQALSERLRDRFVTDEVISVRGTGNGGVELRSGTGSEVFDRVVICAGIGTPALARTAGIDLPVEKAAHLRATCAVRAPGAERLACLQDSSGCWGETGVYAVAEPGNQRYAVGLAGTTPVRDDGAVVEPEAMASFESRVVAYVEEALPGLDPEPVELLHCWVTQLPWGEDAVSVWEHEGVLVPAGHNLFKQAPMLGRLLAAAAAGEKLDSRLRPEARLGADS